MVGIRGSSSSPPQTRRARVRGVRGTVEAVRTTTSSGNMRPPGKEISATVADAGLASHERADTNPAPVRCQGPAERYAVVGHAEATQTPRSEVLGLSRRRACIGFGWAAVGGAPSSIKRPIPGTRHLAVLGTQLNRDAPRAKEERVPLLDGPLNLVTPRRRLRFASVFRPDGAQLRLRFSMIAARTLLSPQLPVHYRLVAPCGVVRQEEVDKGPPVLLRHISSGEARLQYQVFRSSLRVDGYRVIKAPRRDL